MVLSIADQEPLVSVGELKSWLLEEVADERDILVDELQQQFASAFEDLEAKGQRTRKWSEEWEMNMQHLTSGGIASLQANKGQLLARVLGNDGSSKMTKISDGIRPCWYTGNKDQNGLPDGKGMLKYENGDIFVGTFNHGVLNRQGQLTRSKESCLGTTGAWCEGLMEGEMRVETLCGGWIEGYWSKGVPHGYQREFGAKDLQPPDKPMLKSFGRWYRGLRRGYSWQGCFGGGFIGGQVAEEDGSFTGSDIAYIYPDFKMAIVGEFKDGLLVKGYLRELVGATRQELDGILVPTFGPLEANSKECYAYEAPTRKVIAQRPLQRDPWETLRVHVGPSKLPQGGEGLFATVGIPAKALICLFSGVRLNTASLSAKFGDSDYRIRLNADFDLDIPEGYQSLDKYCATLGHKANHSFLPNADWALVEHPRFGLIRGLSSQRDIHPGEEILVNYQMNLADAPDWYKVVWLRHQREHKKLGEESIARILARYESDTTKRVHIPDDPDNYTVPDPKGVLDDEEGQGLELIAA